MMKNKNGHTAALGMQAAFLTGGGVKQATGYRADQDDCTQPHVDQRHRQRTQDEAGQQKANAPVDKLAFETFENKGLLEPLINRILPDHLTSRRML